MDLAALLYEGEDWDGVLYFTGCALAIDCRPRSYISEGAAWGSLPWDLRSLALYYTGRLKQSLEAARKAAQLAGTDQRIAENVRLIRQKCVSAGIEVQE